MKEASAEPQHSNLAQPVLAPRMSDTSPMTRSSLVVLAGDENDLLAESPVFEQANDPGSFPQRAPAARSSGIIAPEPQDDPLDE